MVEDSVAGRSAHGSFEHGCNRQVSFELRHVEHEGAKDDKIEGG